jgi:hypothetical protein
MSDETQIEVEAVNIPDRPPAPVMTPEMETLARIQVLASLANAVQNNELKTLMLSLPAGERLYAIFASAVSREIESVISPNSKLAPKELVETVQASANLRNLVQNLYAMVSEISRAPVLMVLGNLNQQLGGRQVQPMEVQQQPMSGQDGQQQPPQQRPNNPPVPTQRRVVDSGISW